MTIVVRPLQPPAMEARAVASIEREVGILGCTAGLECDFPGALKACKGRAGRGWHSSLALPRVPLDLAKRPHDGDGDAADRWGSVMGKHRPRRLLVDLDLT